MSRDYDNRSSNYEGQEDDPQDRRGSCRYPVANVPAVLGWWETAEPREEHAVSVVETDTGLGSARHSSSRQFDAATYSAIMSRGPALPGAFHGSLTTRPLSTAHRHQNGRASVPAVAGAKALAAPAAEPKASPPALREKTETRSEPRNNGEPRMLNCCARIQDISHTGVSLRSEAAPPVGQSVWVRLDGLEPSDWVEGSLVSPAPGGPGGYHVRIRFHQACPYDFFKATVYSKPEK
jgi:hypothetical protein